jgi:uncharacterized repeat protein (TIGR03803 family)
MFIRENIFTFAKTLTTIIMKKHYLLTASILCFGILTSPFCGAQISTTVNFWANISPQGLSPYGNVILSGNVLFGMTSQGGTNGYGNIFSVDTNGANFKDLHEFNITDGEEPYGSLTLVGNRLFGMTEYGGANSDGCVFSIDTDGSGYKIILPFNGANGKIPTGNLTWSGKVLFGMAHQGGANNGGCVFKIDTDGSAYKDIYDLVSGAEPTGSLILVGKALFGMAPYSGNYNNGFIFKVDTDGTEYKGLWDFHNSSTGSNPWGDLTLLGTKLFGTANLGGANSDGCLFSMDSNGYNYKDIFDFNLTNGKEPYGDLTLSGQVLYGMTYEGGANSVGNIFSIDTTGKGFIDLFDFDNAHGANPLGSLLLSGSMLYGMAQSGGVYGDGVVFGFNDTAISTSTKQLTMDNDQLKVYPNPNDGKFTMQLSGVNGHPDSYRESVEIYNVLGEIVRTQYFVSGILKIDLSSQPAGVYFYRVIAESGKFIGEGKLIIQK